MNKFLGLTTVAFLLFSSTGIEAAPPRAMMQSKKMMNTEKKELKLTKKLQKMVKKERRMEQLAICKTKRALQRAECAHQFQRNMGVGTVGKGRLKPNDCQDLLGTEKADCIKKARTIDADSSSSSSSTSPEGSSSSSGY